MMKQHSNRKVEGEEGWRVWGTLWGGSRGRKWGWNKVKDGLVYQKCPLSVMEKNRQRKKKKERKERMKKWKTDKRSTTEQQRYITLYKQHITFQRTFKQMKTNTPVRATTLHCGLWWKHGSLWCLLVSQCLLPHWKNISINTLCLPPFPESPSGSGPTLPKGLCACEVVHIEGKTGGGAQ